MPWIRNPRRPHRRGRRPGLEGLEARTLLSNLPAETSLLPTLPPASPWPALSAQPGGPLSAADQLIGATATRVQYDIDGSGLAAAVIDTGVGYLHDALGDGFGLGRKVKAGHDFGDNDPDPDATTWAHGTSVAGLIAGSGNSYQGVAPGADIIALRVFGNDNKGSFHKIADALRWVIDHHQEHQISVVNLSIADGNNYSYDWFSNDGAIGQEINNLILRLKELRIPVVTAAGNSFEGDQGMGFTAILPETISVTATDPSDRLLDDAQRLGKATGGDRATDLAAPGSGLRAPGAGESFLDVRGTSFATPLVSGSILLLQSIYQQRFGELPTVDQLEAWLKEGAKTITDTVTGITLGRLDVHGAAARIPAAPAAEEPVVPPSDAPGEADPPAPGGGSGANEDSGKTPEPPVSPPEQTESPAPSKPVDPPPPDEPSTPPPSTEPPPPVEPSTPPDQPVDPPVEPSTPPAEPPPASEPPPAPPENPPEPPPATDPAPDVTDEVLAQLYRNGRLVRQFRPGSADDPTLDALAAFGIDGTVQTVRLWTATGGTSSGTQAAVSPTEPIAAAARPSPAAPGPLKAAGTSSTDARERNASRLEALREARQERALAAASKSGRFRRLASMASLFRGW